MEQVTFTYEGMEACVSYHMMYGEPYIDGYVVMTMEGPVTELNGNEGIYLFDAAEEAIRNMSINDRRY